MTGPDAPTRFKVRCCRDGGRRILLPGDVLICKHCDAGLKVPNGKHAVEVDEGVTSWPPAP